MANETLEKMQEIETAAEEVLMGYRTQAQELRQQVDENLRQLGLTYDDETQKLAEELTSTSQQSWCTCSKAWSRQPSKMRTRLRLR